MTKQEAIKFANWATEKCTPETQVPCDICIDDENLWMYFPDEAHGVLTCSIDLSDTVSSIEIVVWCDPFEGEFQEYDEMENVHLAYDLASAKSIFAEWYHDLKSIGRL